LDNLFFLSFFFLKKKRKEHGQGVRMQSGVKTLSAGGGASLCCLLLLWLIYSHLLREGKDTSSLKKKISLFIYIYLKNFVSTTIVS